MEFPNPAHLKQTRLTSIRTWVPSLASFRGLKIWQCREQDVGWRLGSDLVLLWLWYRSAGTGPIWPLAWELAYATGVALKRQKEKKKKKILNPEKRYGLKVQTWEWSSRWKLKLWLEWSCPERRQIRIIETGWGLSWKVPNGKVRSDERELAKETEKKPVIWAGNQRVGQGSAKWREFHEDWSHLV